VRPYRPPNGIPVRHDGRWTGIAGSIAIHLLISLLILLPIGFATNVLEIPTSMGGGGEGAAGGGGGGRRGTGGVQEKLQYVPITPEQRTVQAPPTAVPVPAPVVERVVPPPVPRPEPVPVPPPTPTPPATPVPQAATTAPAAPASSVVPGVGGGSGNDGSVGSGPGSGGGVGSGIGTGRGSGIGPGTGGGVDSIYPPTLLTMALPPLQPPPKARPYRLVALFDVDEKGKTVLLDFTQSADAKFNRQVRDALAEVRFRPAVRGDGTAVRDTGRFEIEYP
jgi:protein TonB